MHAYGQSKLVVSHPATPLADFIRKNAESIESEWSSFAKTLIPSGDALTPLALSDHIKAILTFIADDLESPQTESEQVKKSHGDAAKQRGPSRSAAEFHAASRLEERFDIHQMFSEYRALRASVVKLWAADSHDLSNTDLQDLTRFHEAVDQAMTESITYYTRTIDHSRNLFLGILGHDLRGPIGAASLCANEMLLLGSLDSIQMGWASMIIKSTMRANQIIVDLFDLTRSRFGSDLSISKGHMDMGSAARDLVDEMRVVHVGREITLEIVGAMAGEWDGTRIGQMFSNLIGNAMQYSPEDTPVEVTIKGQPNEVILSVHNEGQPIPPHEIGGLFDALARGIEGKRGSTNLGLGLYIAKQIVVSHGGTINVTSSEEDGTRFIVRLPRR